MINNELKFSILIYFTYLCVMYTKVIFEFYIKDTPNNKIFTCRRWFNDCRNLINLRSTFSRDMNYKMYYYEIFGFNILKFTYHNNIDDGDIINSTKIINKRDYDLHITKEEKPKHIPEYVEKYIDDCNMPKKIDTNSIDDIKEKKNKIREKLFSNKTKTI